MTPFHSYQLHQVERSVSTAEQRLADEQAGRLAADMAALGRSSTRPAKALLKMVRRLTSVLRPVAAES
jgi:hypothetical protein